MATAISAVSGLALALALRELACHSPVLKALLPKLGPKDGAGIPPAEILAVCVDTSDKTIALLEKLKDSPGLDFPMLSDTDHRVIDRYGLLNDQAKTPVPHPATLVIDPLAIHRSGLQSMAIE